LGAWTNYLSTVKWVPLSGCASLCIKLSLSLKEGEYVFWIIAYTTWGFYALLAVLSPSP
jgi:hypothetical protein